MDPTLYQNHLNILREELLLALGCTEPISIAYAGAKAREVLGEEPIHCTVYCSGNIVKNVKGVVVPNSGGKRGIEIAVILGIVGGDPSQELAVLDSITDQHIETACEMLENGFCSCKLEEEAENLYVAVSLNGRNHTAEVEIKTHHNNITRIVRDGILLMEKKTDSSRTHKANDPDRMLLNLHNILNFANEVKISDVEEILNRQIDCNSAISNEGLQGAYGVEAGRILMKRAQFAEGINKVRIQAQAAAAAGSDARMSGCSLPVVINSGSGNQGITLTMPVVVFGRYFEVSHELLLRALVLANLINIHQKKYIGSLSAYCGATSAATSAACGVAYLYLSCKGQREKIYPILCDTITNSIGTLGGMVCDGAKASCATKISIAVENALLALQLSMEGKVFKPGEGMTMEDPEDTISAVGRMARVGMKSTDVEILNIMLGS